MLRRLEVANYRSLVQFGLELPSPYVCLVGENNVGKSNVVGALKWLLQPTEMRSKGMLSSDLSRTATDEQVRICVQISAADSPTLPDGRLLVGQDGMLSACRTFDFQATKDAQGNLILQGHYAPLATSLIRAFSSSGSSDWVSFEHLDGLRPRLLHSRPADIGRFASGSSAEDQLASLRCPSELLAEDIDWVKQTLARAFPSQTRAEINLVVHEPSRAIGFWDSYGYPVPLAKAGSGVIQVTYTLLRIALARRREAKVGSFGRNLLVFIDEPEQHLTSGAQKAYADVLKGLSDRFQIIVTSHSALFLRRDIDGANVLLARQDRNSTTALPQVRGNTAAVRSTLGITAEDSLYFGEVNVLVEGPTEAAALPVMLGKLEAAAKIQLKPEQITIIQRDGASRIPPFAHLLGQLGLGIVILLDGDRDGRAAQAKIQADPALSQACVIVIPAVSPRREAEFEDLFNERQLIQATDDYLKRRRGWTIGTADFEALYREADFWTYKKWSERLESVLRSKGYLGSSDKLDDVVSKPEIVLAMLDQLDTDDLPHLVVDFADRASELIAQRTDSASPNWLGVNVPSRATSWVDPPENLTDSTDHDL